MQKPYQADFRMDFKDKIDVVFDEDLAESYRSNVESDMKKV